MVDTELITDLEYTLEVNSLAAMAHRNEDVLLYRVKFTYDGHNGIMLTLISKVMAEDIAISLRDFFKNEVVRWAKDNPPIRNG